ncbi:MAG: acyl-ACP--UDP-N-acetylglucosamine O-acyltransferase [Candidatus Methylomirabilia bacterium]
MTMTVEPIHQTAVIDLGARLAAGVRVGAYAVIGPEVELGPEVEIGHHVVLEGRVTVGARTRIGHGSVIGGPPQDLKYKPGTPSGVRIGEETVIREYVTIHRAATEHGWTEIGQQTLIMTMSHIAHDCKIGNHVIIINYAGLTGHVQVEDRATVGGLSGVHPFARVGMYAYIGGCSKVVQDVPPFVTVDGIPATARSVNVVGLKRAGIGLEDRRLIQVAYRILYRSGLSPRGAIERIRGELTPTSLLTHLAEFLETSKLGICGPAIHEAKSPVPEEEGEPIF